MRILASLVLLGLATPAWCEEEAHNFRGRNYDAQRFRKQGPDPDNYITAEEEGLRIRFAPGKAPGQAVGVSWRGRIIGDFDTSARFDILTMEPPQRGNAVGVELYLMLDEPKGAKATERDGIPFSRLWRVGAKTPTAVFQLRTNVDGKRIGKGYRETPLDTDGKHGVLRLVREGPILIASIGAGEPPAFQEVQQYKLGAMDVLMLRFACISGGDPKANLDVRLTDFGLKAQEVAWEVKRNPPAAPGANVPDPPAPASRLHWILWGIVVLVALFFGVFLAVYFSRSKMPSRSAANRTEEETEPAPSPKTGKPKPPSRPAHPKSREA
jgi:hypothetical protein